MAVYLGTATPSAYYLGSSAVSAIYLGSSNVYSLAATITISSQPVGSSSGPTSITLSVTASVTGGGTITYQWQKQGNGGGSFADISGATSSTLSLTGLNDVYNNGDGYRCVLSSTNAVSVTSNVAYISWPFIGFTAQNSVWSSIFFSGAGLAGTPYTKTNYSASIVGMQAEVVCNGALTVRITGQVYSDYGVNFYKNGTLLGTPPSMADTNSGNGDNYTLNASISVVNGDIIRIGDPTGDYINFPSSTLNIWLQ